MLQNFQIGLNKVKKPTSGKLDYLSIMVVTNSTIDTELRTVQCDQIIGFT